MREVTMSSVTTITAYLLAILLMIDCRLIDDAIGFGEADDERTFRQLIDSGYGSRMSRVHDNGDALLRVLNEEGKRSAVRLGKRRGPIGNGYMRYFVRNGRAPMRLG